jgi:hypothetical protein
LFFLIVIGGPIAYHLLTVPPTCTDGIQNQGETAVDRGGPCPLLDTNTLQREAILWARSFKVRDGTYTAVAEVQNANAAAGVGSVHYRFSLYDAQNILVAQREGDTYLMPEAVTPIVEPRIDTGNRIVAHTYFEFTEPLTWARMGNTATALTTDQKQLTGASDLPLLSAQAHNISTRDVIGPVFVAVVYDGGGNAIAASETQLERLNAGSSAPITFAWPSAFAVQPSRIDILPSLPPVPTAAPAQ